MAAKTATIIAMLIIPLKHLYVMSLIDIALEILPIHGLNNFPWGEPREASYAGNSRSNWCPQADLFRTAPIPNLRGKYS